GTGGNTTLQFGGNPALPRTGRTSGAEVFDALAWSSIDRKHRTRVTFNLRDDAFSQEQYPNQHRTYTFNSIADVGANRPSRVSRGLVGQKASASELTAALSIGDDWRGGQRSQILYGVRVDANRFLDHPVYNPAVASKFGASTDYVPRVIDVSPRIG